LTPTEVLDVDLDSSETPSPTFTPSPTITPTPTITPYPPQIEDDYGVVLVLVGSGPFILGAEDGDPDEKPERKIILDGFYIDKFEVTNASYQECVADRRCLPPTKIDSQTRSKYYGTREFANYPVIHVSWSDASSYCEWRGARLPTELEWEKAARGPDGQRYPWGDQFESGRANYCGGAVFCPSDPDDGYKDTAPVDAFKEGISPYGAYQMAGNVNEWIADWYDKNFYNGLSDGDENPPGPARGQVRGIRGGSFGLNAEKLRSTNRSSSEPSASSEFDGFRCAIDLP
jgi:formylglycine-generating enzyme required for sulfatase activity